MCTVIQGKKLFIEAPRTPQVNRENAAGLYIRLHAVPPGSSDGFRGLVGGERRHRRGGTIGRW